MGAPARSVVSTAGFERKLDVVKAWLTPCRTVLATATALNRLLLQMQLQLKRPSRRGPLTAGRLRDCGSSATGAATRRCGAPEGAGVRFGCRSSYGAPSIQKDTEYR